MIISNIEISGVWAWIVFASIVKYLHIAAKQEQRHNIQQFILHISSSIIAAYLLMTAAGAISSNTDYQIPAALIGSLLGRTLIDYMNMKTFQPILERLFNVKK